MKDQLVLMDRADGWWEIVWIVDGDTGAAIGEWRTAESTAEDWEDAAKISKDPDEALTRYVTAEAIRDQEDGFAIYRDGSYLWETKTRAAAALKRGKTKMMAWRASMADKAIPEWAKTALANGWKAPKGWKP